MDEPTAVWTDARGYIGVACQACGAEGTVQHPMQWCPEGLHYICACCAQPDSTWCLPQDEEEP